MKHNPGFLKLVERAKHTIRECTSAEVKARLDRGERFHFIDVREDEEFAKDHAKGARHIGRGVLERDIESLIPDKQAEIILYCGGGYRSALAAESLGQMGYMNVCSMDGGIRAWREAGYPVERCGGQKGS
jgi:rhodanese-related sulfurtransferase